MEKEVVKHHHNHNHQPHNTSTTNNSISSSATSLRERQIIGEGLIKPAHSPDFDLRWGSRKRLRCMKTPTFRVDRRVVRSDNNNSNSNGVNGSNHHQHTTNGHFNLRQRAASSSQPLHQRVLRYIPWFVKLFFMLCIWSELAILFVCVDWIVLEIEAFLISGSWFWAFSCFLVCRKPLVVMDEVGGIWTEVSSGTIETLLVDWGGACVNLCWHPLMRVDIGSRHIKEHPGRSEQRKPTFQY